MSMPSLSNHIIQTNQNVGNQVQSSQVAHALLNNVTGAPNNGIPLATAITTNAVQQQQANVDQGSIAEDIKPSITMDNVSMAGASLLNIPQTPSAHTNLNNAMKTYGSNAAAGSSSEPQQLLTKTRMADLIRDIDPNIYMEEEVEDYLLGYVDDFVDRVLNGASIIAKHRHVKNIEVKDVQMFVARNFNMWAPGLGTDALRPYKRSLTTESHKQRLALIRKSLKKY